LHLLHGDDVAAADEPADAGDVGEVTLRRAARWRHPVPCQVGEGAQVPGADDDVAAGGLGRHDLVKGSVEPRHLGGNGSGNGGDIGLRRQPALLRNDVDGGPTVTPVSILRWGGEFKSRRGERRSTRTAGHDSSLAAASFAMIPPGVIISVRPPNQTNRSTLR
jgi:hypothetical protein